MDGCFAATLSRAMAECAVAPEVHERALSSTDRVWRDAWTAVEPRGSCGSQTECDVGDGFSCSREELFQLQDALVLTLLMDKVCVLCRRCRCCCACLTVLVLL
jgi:hypothetical protein